MSHGEEMAHSEGEGSRSWKWAARSARDETGRRWKRGGRRGRKSEKYKARWYPKEEEKRAGIVRGQTNEAGRVNSWEWV